MSGKKLLVFSDTHGNTAALKAVFNWAKDFTPPNDTICSTVFLGDGASDIRTAAEATGFFSDWNLVRGNNDYSSAIPDSTVIDFAEHRFLLCHGHRHSLYGSYHSLIAAGKKNGANVVLFGHTHVPFNKRMEDILLINPGSVGRPRSRIGATFAVIECKEDLSIEAEFFGIGSNENIHKVKVG
jgi:putative phosphoesterase